MAGYTPQSFGASLALSILSTAAWGSWSNTVKAAGAVPFACFYLDYTIGVFTAALLVFVSLGAAAFFHDAAGGSSAQQPRHPPQR